MGMFKTEQRENPREGSEHKNKQKCLRGRPRSRWEQQVMKDMQKEERTWEEIEEEELWKDRDTVDGEI
jgi:hypothetical protein